MTAEGFKYIDISAPKTSIFTPAPFTSFKTVRNLQSSLVLFKLYLSFIVEYLNHPGELATERLKFRWNNCKSY